MSCVDFTEIGQYVNVTVGGNISYDTRLEKLWPHFDIEEMHGLTEDAVYDDDGERIDWGEVKRAYYRLHPPAVDWEALRHMVDVLSDGRIEYQSAINKQWPDLDLQLLHCNVTDSLYEEDLGDGPTTFVDWEKVRQAYEGETDGHRRTSPQGAAQSG